MRMRLALMHFSLLIISLFHCRIEEVYESTNEIYIVQELCVGGDLFDRLDEQTAYHYTEANCARLVKQMLSSIRYLHSRAIVHRDLKLENFLFSSREPDADLKVCTMTVSMFVDSCRVALPTTS
jgi:calcium-dependent protein kinase